MRVGIVGLGFRLGYLGHVCDAVDGDFAIAGCVDPSPAGLADLVAHHRTGAPLPVATRDVVDLRPTWDRLDEALAAA